MSASAGAIRAGAAFVELSLRSNQLLRGMDYAKSRFTRFAATMTSLSARLGGQITRPILGIFEQVVDRAASLGAFANKIGATVESVSSLAHAFEVAGSSVGEFESEISALYGKITEAASTNAPLLDKLRTLGTGREFEHLNLDQKFERIAEAMDRIPDAALRLHFLKELGFESLAMYLQKGTEGLKEFRKEGAKGLISTEQSQQALAVSRTLTLAWQDVKQGILEVGFALLPTASKIGDVRDEIRRIIGEARQWVKENKAVVLGVATAGIGLTALAGLTLTAAGSVVVLTTAVSGAVAVVGLLKAGLLALFSPIGLVLAGVGAIGYVILTQTQAGIEFLDELRARFKTLGDVARNTWGGIAAAIQKNNWTLAGKIAMKGLEVTWHSVVLGMTEEWIDFKETFVDTWREVVATIKVIFIELGAVFVTSVTTPIRTALLMVADALRGIPGAGALKNKLRGIAAEIPGFKDIRADAEKQIQGVGAGVENQRAGADAFRQKQLAEAQARKDAAQAELDALNAQAKAGEGWFHRLQALADRVNKQEVAAGRPGGRGLMPLAEMAKGAFQGPIAQQLGYGENIPQRQLDALQAIDNKVAGLPQVMQNVAQNMNRVGH